MISGSKEQLQQQLEYTQLKPDCHSRGISKMQSRFRRTICNKIVLLNLEKYYRNVWNASDCFQPSCMNRASDFEWHRRSKEGRVSMRDGERCGMSKKVNTAELIGQRFRVRVNMLRFYGSSGRNAVGRGQHSSNRISGISTRTIHQSTSPSLSQTI